MLGEERGGAAVGEVGGRLGAALAELGGEAMVDARIVMDGDVRIGIERGMDRSDLLRVD